MNKSLAPEKFCVLLQHNECISRIHYEIVRSALYKLEKHILGAPVPHYAILSIVRPQSINTSVSMIVTR